MSKKNKALFTGLLTATVAVAAVPAGALANTPEQLQEGVYFAEFGEFYTTEELAALANSNPVKLFNLMSGDQSKIVLVLSGFPNPISFSQTVGKDPAALVTEATTNPTPVPDNTYKNTSGEEIKVVDGKVEDTTPEENSIETFFYNLVA